MTSRYIRSMNNRETTIEICKRILSRGPLSTPVIALRSGFSTNTVLYAMKNDCFEEVDKGIIKATKHHPRVWKIKE